MDGATAPTSAYDATGASADARSVTRSGSIGSTPGTGYS